MEKRSGYTYSSALDDPKVLRWLRCRDGRAVQSAAKYPGLAYWLRLVDPTLLESAFYNEQENMLVLATSSQKVYDSCRARVGTLRFFEVGLAIGLFRDDKIVAYFGSTEKYYVTWREGRKERRVQRKLPNSVKRKLRKGERTMEEYRSLLTSVAPFLPWNVREDVDKGWVRLLALNGRFVRLGVMYVDVEERAERSLKAIEAAFERRFGQEFNVKIERLKYCSRPAK